MSEEEETAEVDESIWERSTAPQSLYTSRQVLVGIVVLVVGAVVTFGLPLALV